MDKPRLLDLCCKAGGASEGYDDAGFEVIGVDIEPQKNYPFKFSFCQDDALEVLDLLIIGGSVKFGIIDRFFLEDIDAIHASPPCQDTSMASLQWRLKGKTYPQIISTLRRRLLSTGKPFVIENVKGSPLLNPIMLTATMFGLRLKRDRYFELHGFNVPFTLSPTSPKPVKMGRFIKDGDILQPIGHFSGVSYAQKEMGLPGRTQGELAEALPRAYTKYIGKYLMQAIQGGDEL